MPIPLPRLDDRSFDDLVRDGIAHARQNCPDWTDFSAGDPGVTLIEVFAFLTDALLYRLNRVPPKLQLALLNLAGVSPRPPGAAAVDLLISRTGNAPVGPITLPAGTIVTSADATVAFVLPADQRFAASAKSATVRALHCELVDAELLGVSTGLAAQSFAIARPPVIGPTADGLDFLLAVETEQRGAGRTIREADGKAFELWTEVPSFTNVEPGASVYVLDRVSGRVIFSPASAKGGYGAIPPAGRQIRAWYRRGGGRAGNVSPGVLTQFKTPVAGLEVTNPERAAGGSDVESLDELLRRAPAFLSSLEVAVTARDYEQVALAAGGIARASAAAAADKWRHASAGVVLVQVMPHIDHATAADGAITIDLVREHRVAALKERVGAALELRRPLGVLTRVAWIDVRPVSVSARVIAAPGADIAAVEQSIRRRLASFLSPLNARPLGRSIRASEVYEQILAEPGVRYADQLSFAIGDVPAAEVSDLIHDPHQPGCWFAAAGTAAHRTLDNGESWSIVFAQDGLRPTFLRRHPSIPGLIVLAAARTKGASLFLSRDLGEEWGEPIAQFSGDVFDAAWVDRSGHPTLLIATSEGLRQLIPGNGSGPSPLIVDKAIDAKGFWSVVSNVSPSGIIAVVVAARSSGGVYLSPLGGLSDTFHPIGLKDKDVRHLAVQSTGARDFLWATVGAEAGEQGEGAFRIELRANGQDDPGGLKPFNVGWQGGSCEALAFADNLVFGASNRSGVLALDVNDAKPAWRAVKIDAGLPIRDTERLLETVDALAAMPRSGGTPIVLSGGPRGVHRSEDAGTSWNLVSQSSFTDRVPIPPDWLYCAGDHRIDVVREAEAKG